MHDETPACIEFDDACVKRGGHVIWQHGTFSIPQGSVTAIVGTNGAGKTTMMKAELGLIPTAHGSIKVLGQPAGSANRRIGYVPQSYASDIESNITAEQSVLLGLTGTRFGIHPVTKTLREKARKAMDFVELQDKANYRLSDLSGGHSGDDIDKGRMNSNKLVARLLWNGAQRFGLRLSRFDGGNLRNAIPREAYAVFAVPSGSKAGFEAFYKEFAGELAAEAKFREPNFKIGIEEVPAASVIDAATQRNLLYALVGLPNGVIEMSLAMPGLVETSTNLASVKFEGDDRIVVTTSQRSSVESAKVYASQMIESVFALAGAEVSHSEGYPGWAPNPQSKLLEITVASYEKLFGVKPKVRAIHAGLECGLFLEKYPHLEMVSFGPTLRGVHSPDERLEIATVPKFWDLLADILKKVE